MERGIIASPGIIKKLPNGFAMQRGLSLEEIYYYTLYWDKVVIPGNNLVYISLPNEDELVNVGALTRPRVNFQGTFKGDAVADAILSCQSKIAENLVIDKSIDWVIHQFGQEINLPINFTKQREVLRVDLINSLPVPLNTANIHEVLEFKNKRKDELMQLHNHLDALYEIILSASDQELAYKKILSDLQSSIRDLDKISKEKFKKTKKFEISTELSLSGRELSTAINSGVITTLLSTPTNGFIVGGLTALISLLKINFKNSNTFEPAANNTKLSYLSNAKTSTLIV